MTCEAFLTALPARLENLKNRLRAATDGLTDEQLNQRTSAHLWTIGQQLEHVHLAAVPYLQALALLPAEAEASAHVKFTRIGAFLAKAAGPEGNAPVPKLMVPGSGPFERGLIERFDREHDELALQAARLKGADLNRLKVRNAVLGFIQHNAADVLEFTTQHAARHIGQIERIAEELKRG